MFANKPIIGIVGGIGSGKSFVARLFGELGCRIIDSDQQVRDAYRRGEVLQRLRDWWGPEVFTAGGELDKKAIARKIFADAAERQRLEGLLHPLVNQARISAMEKDQENSQVLAFVWDTPLLFETGLQAQCDAVVFVEAPVELRLSRLQAARGWSAEQLTSREISQLPLDKKREMSQYVVRNTADAGHARKQVRDVLSRILN